MNTARWLLAIAWTACLLAELLILFVDVESVLITGPVIFILGLSLAILGRRARYAWLVPVGLSHAGICCLFVFLVNHLHWGPSRAQHPFAVMGAFHVLLTLWPTLRAYRRPPRVEHTWACEECGYLLCGLAGARCPECGRPFDPAALAGLPPPTEASTATIARP